MVLWGRGMTGRSSPRGFLPYYFKRRLHAGTNTFLPPIQRVKYLIRPLSQEHCTQTSLQSKLRQFLVTILYEISPSQKHGNILFHFMILYYEL